ncbi:MAG: hypothetical protein AB8B96_17755 [Lysobacterales bacterium]
MINNSRADAKPHSSGPLLSRLERFTFQQGTPSLSFAQRLARDNGWTQRYADRVIKEYLRFVYLCATGERSLTPSEEVDQAWHLHMVYTQSYWHDLCEDMLGKPLHHNPTTGGRRAAEGFAHAYQETLDQYQAAFGQPPPVDVWPPVEKRFANASRFQRVNLSEVFLLPVRRVKQGVYALGLGLVAAPAYAASDWVNLLTVIGGVILIPAAVIGLFGAKMKSRNRSSKNNPAAGGCGATGGSTSKNTDYSDGGGDSGCGAGCGGCGG